MHDFAASILSPQTIWGSFVLLFVGGLAFYPLTSGTSYLYYWVLRRERYFPPEQQRAHESAEVRKEWRWAFYNLLGNAALTAPIYAAITAGHTKVYFDVAEHGWGYLFASAAIELGITELLVYWAHRLLHLPLAYKLLHVHHHRFRVPSPWTSMAFHPLDSFAQAAPHHLCALLFPVHAGVYLFFIMFLQVWSTFIHERVSWTSFGFINYTAHHTAHHKFNKYNYGQFFTFCDRLFGTYKSPVGVVYDGSAHSRLPKAN